MDSFRFVSDSLRYVCSFVLSVPFRFLLGFVSFRIPSVALRCVSFRFGACCVSDSSCPVLSRCVSHSSRPVVSRCVVLRFALVTLRLFFPPLRPVPFRFRFPFVSIRVLFVLDFLRFVSDSFHKFLFRFDSFRFGFKALRSFSCLFIPLRFVVSGWFRLDSLRSFVRCTAFWIRCVAFRFGLAASRFGFLCFGLVWFWVRFVAFWGRYVDSHFGLVALHCDWNAIPELLLT